MNITGGKVTFGRTVKTGDFENKRSDVELSFGIDETDAGKDVEAFIEQVGQMAKSRCLTLLELKTAPAPVVQAGNKEAAAASLNAADADKTPGKKAPNPKTPAKKDEPKEPEKAAEQPKQDAAKDEWETPAPAKEITDTELMAACSRKNQELQKDHLAGKAPVMVREVIWKFAGETKPAREIPQEKRADFLKALDELK